MDILEINSKEYEIPDIFLDIDYIPAELVCRGRELPTFVMIDGKKWEINLRSSYPFYERYHRGRRKNEQESETTKQRRDFVKRLLLCIKKRKNRNRVQQ